LLIELEQRRDLCDRHELLTRPISHPRNLPPQRARDW
jgi:hypothetical protein